MSTKGVITRELSESVRNILGRNVKISLKCLVRMETKPEKTENRLLAFSACRLFILTAKVPAKMEHTFHYLDIQAIESKKPNQLLLTLDGKLFTFYSMDPESEDVDHMIIQLGTAIKSVFPQVPLEYILRKIDVVPPSRLQAMIEYNQDLETKDTGPCGGFSIQYACMCDFHGLPYREEVAWDVDTIYLSHDCKELSLQDFDHLEGRDLVPIISALSYNAWFTKFRASNTRLSSDALEQILQVMKKSISIEELYLDNTGIKWDFAHKLSLALISNTYTPLHTLDLSNNLIEDKGAGQLSGSVGKLQKGLMHLNLARTGVTARGVNTLAHALSLNRAMPSTLTYLNLSDNVFKEDINNLYNFLAQPNALTHLDLSGTECALDMVFGALLRGCTQKLAHLNLARNQFSTKKSKDIIVPPSFKAFFSSTVALKYLNMSGNKLPNEALKGMLLGLACNEIATDVALDMSSNELRSQGALVLESCLPGIRCLGMLDVSDNGFDADLAAIVTAVSKNKSIRHLNIGRNFVNLKPKHVTKVLDAVVQLIQEEDSALESLSLAESKLRADTCLIINALGSNQCLTSLDITGNYMGLAGAKTLAKALQINSKLKSILWDRNGTPPQGFQDIAYALEKNYSLKYMPCPIFDVTAAMKVAPEKTEAAMKKIEELLHRNVSPKKLCNGQAFRLQQGFLLSTTHQMVDRLMVHVQDAIGTHKSSSDDSLACVDEIEKAESFLHDANNAKQLLTRLHEVVLQQEESGNPVELKLQDFAVEMASVLENYVKGTASCMLKCVEDQCPNIMCDEKVRRDVERLCQEKGVIPSDFIRQSLLDQAAADIINKVSEVNLAMAAHISDRILDEVIESLSRSHKGLVERMKQQRCSTPDVLRNRTRLDGTIRSSQSGESHLDNLSENSESPTATPKLPSKRKSVHNRKVRPRSVVDHVEGIAADDIPDLLPKDADDRSLPNLSPMSEKLEHLGKGRPRRPKTRAPTRPCIQTREIREDIQDLDEGLAHFFRRHHKTTNTTPSMSPDIEEPSRFRSESNSTSASSIVITSEISSSRQSLEKSPENNTEKRSFMRGITNFLSRMTTDTSHVHKSKSYDLTDKVESPACSPNHRVTEDDSKISTSSPQLECRGKKQNGGSFVSFVEIDNKQTSDVDTVDVSRNSLPEPIVKDDSPRLSRVEKIGIPLSPVKGRGADLLAEMKARQEKRTLVSPVQKPGSDERPSSESPETSPSLLQSVKLKPTGLAESLRSPTDAFPREKREGGSPTVSSTPSSPVGCRNTPGLKYRPPPVAPKPRPKSVIGTTDSRQSGEFILSPEDIVASELSASSQEVSSSSVEKDLPSLPEVAGTKDSVSVRVKSMHLTTTTEEITESVVIKSSSSLVNVSSYITRSNMIDSAICSDTTESARHAEGCAGGAGSSSMLAAPNTVSLEGPKFTTTTKRPSPIVVENCGIDDVTDV